MPDETLTTAPAADQTLTDPPADAGAEAPAEGEEAAEDPNAKAIEDARKRQAGAEKARQEAIRERDELKARLDALEASSKKPATKPAESDDAEARIRAAEQAAEERVKAAEAKATADILNSKFPAARAKFPEITDTAKLAELEVLFGESDTPTPVGNSPSRPAAPKRYEDMTLAELREAEKKLTKADLGLNDF